MVPETGKDDRDEGPQPITSASRTITDPASTISGIALDTLALFKTESKVTGKTVVIGREEFIAKVINGLRVDVFYPERVIPVGARRNSKLIETENYLAEYRERSALILAFIDRERGRVRDQLVDEREDTERRRLATSLEAWDILAARLPALNTILDNTITQFFPDPDEDDDSEGDVTVMEPERRILGYLRAEAFSEKFLDTGDNSNFYWLDVSVTKAGGSMRNKSSAVIDIFTGGRRLSFSGGAITNYRVFGSDGRVIAADTVLSYMPYKRSKKIASYRCVNVNATP